jgi:putative inorganic carbon (HCO3(-)) transporter
MRDIALVVFFIAMLVPMLKHPWIGVVMWVWLSVMNPHRLTYGFAYDLPFAAVTAAVTLIGLVTTKDERKLSMVPPVTFLAAFTLWMCVTTVMAVHPDDVYMMWSRVMKIMLMTFVAIALIQDRRQIQWVVYALVVSLGYYGAKGGVFTAATGGGFIVWGPAGSFIEGNNELALALVAVIPLIRYLQLQMTPENYPKLRAHKWIRHAMAATMVLTALAALGSQSRGALVAIAAMVAFFWWKSRNKAVMAIALIILAVAGLSFMPDSWTTRMHTIQTYDEDASALGRLNAWAMTWNLACHNFFGGGYSIYDADMFARYAPNPLDVHAAHSIYFQILGEHGFIGLFFFLGVGASTWLLAGRARRKAKAIPELGWAVTLLDMSKVSMIGFGVGGAFLSLAYFDLPYYVMVIIVATHGIVMRTAASKSTEGLPDLRRRQRFERSHAALDPSPVEVAPASNPRPAYDLAGGFGQRRLPSRT